MRPTDELIYNWSLQKVKKKHSLMLKKKKNYIKEPEKYKLLNMMIIVHFSYFVL